jgi:hypothetical protein
MGRKSTEDGARAWLASGSKTTKKEIGFSAQKIKLEARGQDTTLALP